MSKRNLDGPVIACLSRVRSSGKTHTGSGLSGAGHSVASTRGAVLVDYSSL